MTRPVTKLIEAMAQMRAAIEADPGKLQRLKNLQRWQVDRLLRTYADFRRSAQHRAAVDFFAQELYGPHHFEERDRGLRLVLESWHRVLPKGARDAVAAALELELLTQELDLAVLDALDERRLDAATYADAYRLAGRYADRKTQIALIIESGKALDALIANPWVGRALQLASVPARIAGVTKLHEFLVRGYQAFAKMHDTRKLLQAIEEREGVIMNNLFTSHPDPFSERTLHAEGTKRTA